MTVKLWHDDICPPPDDSWTWARTNAAAQAVLAARPVAEASLDHDLGLHGFDPHEQDADLRVPPAGWKAEEGIDLVRWMIRHDRVPPRVTIHSWNPPGAKRMADELVAAGAPSVVVRPRST